MQKDKKDWTVRKVSFAQAEELDIAYWADMSIGERMKEATKWIEEVWHMHKKVHGGVASIANGKHLKSQTDEDDF